MQLTKTYCLLIMIILTSCIFFVENIVGQITNSVILIADSYHLLSDVLALVVGVVCIRVSIAVYQRLPKGGPYGQQGKTDSSVLCNIQY